MSENCQENCAGLSRLENRMEEYHAQNSAAHQQMYDRLRELETSRAVKDAQYETILDKLDSLNEKVEALEAKPGKRWDGLVDKIIWAVGGAVVAFLLAKVGL